MLKLYNSLTKQIEEFKPLKPPKVGMYTCGLTVYDYAHIGNLRKYVNDDILRRALMFSGYQVTHVQNVTDVGHLVSDEDEGEDKMEKGAAREGKTVWELAEFYTNYFYNALAKLNILKPTIVCKATETIKDQIELIQRLIAKGYAYETEEAVYYDISKFPSYNKLFSQDLTEKQVAVREEVETGLHKQNPADFALWFKLVGRFKNHVMHWPSPWGEGFPGWHIECSAISMKYLGETIDIHTGGQDHLPVHHPNEIAQSEAATGKQFVRYWIHGGWLLVNNMKMSKSLNNFYTLEDLEKKGFDPLDLRYFYLTAHYRTTLNFTWQALEAAKNSRQSLMEITANLKSQKEDDRRTVLSPEKMEKTSEFRDQFFSAIDNDLNTPQALSVVWSMVKSNIPAVDKYDLLMSFDQVLGLDLKNASSVREVSSVPQKVSDLVKKRNYFRSQLKWAEADQARAEIEKEGYLLEDTAEGTKVVKK